MEMQPEEHERQSRLWAMAIHLTQLCNFMVPMAGIIIPIVIWQVKKQDFPELEVHGKIVVNWMLTALILSIICFVLSFVIIGIFLFLALGVLGIVFPVIGGLKANAGEAWSYPMTFSFIK